MNRPDNWEEDLDDELVENQDEEQEEIEESEEDEGRKIWVHPIDNSGRYEGRRKDRAKVWELSKAEVLGASQEIEDFYALDQDIIPIIDQATQEAQKRMLSKLSFLLRELHPDNVRNRDYPRRGDIVILGTETYSDKKNDGIYFYDGSRIITSELYKWIIAVPSQFQVLIEFPIRYWEGRILGQYSISFDFGRYFPNVTLDEIQMRDNIPFFSFQQDDDLYLIYPDVDPESPEEIPSSEAFLTQLQTAQYFWTNESRFQHVENGLGPLFVDDDQDFVLYLDMFQ